MLNENFLTLLQDQDIISYPNEPMKNHTTFHIGGNADCFCEVKTVEALKKITSLCKQNNIPCFIIGLGSNLLVSDNGFKGIVIKLGGTFTEMSIEDNKISCGAGASLASACVLARKNSLSGLEFAWGIPGSVGGAAYMNAGAYDGEMKDVISEVTFMDKDGNIKTCQKDKLDFSYRHSVFTDTENIILSVTFTLRPEQQIIINDRMQELMDKREIRISVKSACSVPNTPSRAVFAVSRDRKNALSSFRVSLSHLTTEEEVGEFLKALREIIETNAK